MEQSCNSLLPKMNTTLLSSTTQKLLEKLDGPNGNEIVRLELATMLYNARSCPRILEETLVCLQYITDQLRPLFVNHLNVEDRHIPQDSTKGPHEESLVLFLLGWLFEMVQYSYIDQFSEILTNMMDTLHSYDVVRLVKSVDAMIPILQSCLRYIIKEENNIMIMNGFPHESFTVNNGFMAHYKQLVVDNQDRAKILALLIVDILRRRIMMIETVVSCRMQQLIPVLMSIAGSLEEYEDEIIGDIIDRACGCVALIVPLRMPIDDILLTSMLENLLMSKGQLCTKSITQFIRRCGIKQPRLSVDAMENVDDVENIQLACAMIEFDIPLYQKCAEASQDFVKSNLRDIVLKDLDTPCVLKVLLSIEHGSISLPPRAHDHLQELMKNAIVSQESCDRLVNLIFNSGCSKDGDRFDPKFKCRFGRCDDFPTISECIQMIETNMRSDSDHWKKLLLCLTMSIQWPLLTDSTMRFIIDSILAKFRGTRSVIDLWILITLPTNHRASECWDALPDKTIMALSAFVFAKHFWPDDADDIMSIKYAQLPEYTRGLICLSSNGARLANFDESAEMVVNISIGSFLEFNSGYRQGYRCDICESGKTSTSETLIKFDAIIQVLSGTPYRPHIYQAVINHFPDPVAITKMNLWRYCNVSVDTPLISTDFVGNLVNLSKADDIVSEGVGCMVAMQAAFDFGTDDTLRLILGQCGDAIVHLIGKHQASVETLDVLIGDRAVAALELNKSAVVAHAFALQRTDTLALLRKEQHIARFVVEYFPKLAILLATGIYPSDQWEKILDGISTFSNISLHQLVLACRQEIAKELICGLGYSDDTLVQQVITFMSSYIKNEIRSDIIQDRLPGALFHIERAFCSIVRNRNHPVSDFPILRRRVCGKSRDCWYEAHTECSLLRSLRLAIEFTGIRNNGDAEKYLSAIRTAIVYVSRLPTYTHCRSALIQVLITFRRCIGIHSSIDQSTLLSFAACVNELRVINEIWPLDQMSMESLCSRAEWEEKFNGPKRILLPWHVNCWIPPIPPKSKNSVRPTHSTPNLNSPIIRSGTSADFEQSISQSDVECLLNHMANIDDHILQIYLLRKLSRIIDRVEISPALCGAVLKSLKAALSYYSADLDQPASPDIDVPPFSCQTIKLLIGKSISKLSVRLVTSKLRSIMTNEETNENPRIIPKSSHLSDDISWLVGLSIQLSVSFMGNDMEVDAKHCAAYAIQGLFNALSPGRRSNVLSVLSRLDRRSMDIVDSCISNQEGQLVIRDEVSIDRPEDINHENWICGTALKLLGYVVQQTHTKADESTIEILKSLVFILTKDSHLSKWMIPGFLSIVNVKDSMTIAQRFNDVFEDPKVSVADFDTIAFTCISIRQHQMAQQTVSMCEKIQKQCPLAAFMIAIDKPELVDLLAKRNAFTDALFELELDLLVEPDANVSRFDKLQEIYWNLGDRDNVTGVMHHYRRSINAFPSLRMVALSREAVAESVDAAACYEVMLTDAGQSDSRLELCKRYLRSLIAFGQLYTAAATADREKQECDDQSIMGFQMETAWRMNDWKRLDSICKQIDLAAKRNGAESRSVCDTFESNMGNIINAYLNRTPVDPWLNRAFVNQTELLAEHLNCISAGVHTGSRKCLINLETLNEIDKSLRAQSPLMLDIDRFSNLHDVGSVSLYASLKKAICAAIWDEIPGHFRADLVTAQSRACRMILADVEINAPRLNDWLISSMKSSLTIATESVRDDPLRLCQLFVERAHWFYNPASDGQSDTFEAISELNKAEELAVKTNDQQTRAVIKLLQARWRTHSALSDWESLLEAYTTACEYCSRWSMLNAEAHFSLAYFYDYVIGTSSEKNQLIVEMCEAYLTTITSSISYENPGRDQQCLSRLFTHFFFLGKKIHDAELSCSTGSQHQHKQRMSQQLASIASLIRERLLKTRNTHLVNSLVIIFNQLISRVCHENNLVSQTIEDIICVIFETFPERATWLMMSGSQSSFKTRQERCKRILSRASKQNTISATAIKDAMNICTHLTELCARKPPSAGPAGSMTFKKHFPNLVSLAKTGKVLLPIQSQVHPSSDNLAQYNRSSLVYFEEFEDTIEVMKSLQKPKKIVVRGSNGERHAFLCKARDDLRVDQRMIEVCQLINRCFIQRSDTLTPILNWNYDDQSPTSVEKINRTAAEDLCIRTYCVMPITESCGIIEIVPNLLTLRSILDKLYTKYNRLCISKVAVRQIMEARHGTDQNKYKYEVFTKKLLQIFKPSVLHHWFMSDQFSTVKEPIAHKWYSARMNYCRTAAVMSMVGWMVGLGDRHNENILLDAYSGDCVHVDYNCLFNKGEMFQVPEIVPFRLTHNMVDAMGILGVEGIFRQTCEKVTHLMRKHKDILLAVLGTFVYDPLLEWKRVTSTLEQIPPRVLAARAAAARAEATHGRKEGETANPTGQSEVDNILWRLNGHVGKAHDSEHSSSSKMTPKQSSPLSVSGQVDMVIREAMNEKSLAQMFIGWAPYL